MNAKVRAAIWRVYLLSRSGQEKEVGRIIADADKRPDFLVDPGVWFSRRDPAPLAFDRIKVLS